MTRPNGTAFICRAFRTDSLSHWRIPLSRLTEYRATSRYNYQVERLWQEKPQSYFTARLGLVPLAPLTDVSDADLTGIVQQMADRINREPQPRPAKLWTATYLLMGLRYSDEL